MPIISSIGGASSRGFGQIIGAAGGEKFFVSETLAPAYTSQGQPIDAVLYNDSPLITVLNYDNSGTTQIAYARDYTSGNSAVFQPSLNVKRGESGYTTYPRTSAKDSSGNIWVGYISTGAPSSIRLVKFDPTGTFVAAYSYFISSTGSTDSLSSFQMVITDNDNIYISFIHTRWYYCGGCPTYESYPALFVRFSNGTTYSGQGSTYAPQQFQKSSIWTDGTNVIGAYKNGNFWVTIRWNGSATGVLSNWASDNAQGYTQYYNASCCDPSGNMYFTFLRQSNTYIVRINSTGGSPAWSFFLNNIPSPYYGAENGSIDYGNDGYLYVAIPLRNSDDSGAINTVLILKMTTSGSIVWQRTLKITMSSVTGSGVGMNEIFILADKKNSFYIITSFAGNSGNTTGRFLVVCKLPKDGTKTGTYTNVGSGGYGTYVYSNSSASGYNDGWPWTNYIPGYSRSLNISATTPTTYDPAALTIGNPVVKYIP